MHISAFEYHLPPELIAQKPLDDRSASRMMTVDRSTREIADRRFSEFPGRLREDDLLVLNNTKVFPARMYGQTLSGANVEVFLVREMEDGRWETLARPAKRLRPGKAIRFSKELSGIVLEKAEDGKITLQFETGGDFYQILDRIGRTPLPPYIRRDASLIDADRERYQTVFAAQRGAIAAPTAGLHFTPDVLQVIREKGVVVAELTLHVGYGTFEPVRVDDIDEHTVSPESYFIDNATADLLNKAKQEARRIVAVGTTTTRALEHNRNTFDEYTAGSFSADLTITPGYRFKAIDALLTNFHLPKSSLLVLVSTFAGRELIMSAYQHAVAEGYRFYSYGDCMFIS